MIRRSARTLLCLGAVLAAAPVLAAQITLATISPDLSRAGPGLLLRDIRSGEDAQVAALQSLLAARRPDVVLLTGVDWDLDGVALSALADALRDGGAHYPHPFAPRPNSGFDTGLDMDGDGRRGGPGDALGWGAFPGKAGLALVSRWPVDAARLQDFTDVLWRDLPGATLPTHPDGTAFPSAQAQALQPLSSTGHWAVPVLGPGGAPIWVAAFSAAPPLFDGEEQRNLLRNRDEIRLWSIWLDGGLTNPAPVTPVVVMGKANTDPDRGAGDKTAVNALRTHPRLQDPDGLRAPTARFAAPPDGPGALRINYILPDRALQVVAAGIDWHPDLRHGLVWVTVTLPE